jgi:isocitrate dehydrogenase kinase/phosphatase
MLESVFYRGRAAYLIGRIRTGVETLPLVIALRNNNGKVVVDAVLATEREISILFSFTHSYFHVAVDQPIELINFLKTILPQKRVSELYTSLGFFKHGKAELYRELSRTLDVTDEQFRVAPGQRGMVMSVFTLPSFNVVFKVIKDRFEFPKHTSAGDIKRKYQMVFYHDRVGRLVDAQEYSQLKFDRSLFPGDLLEELIHSAGQNIIVSKGDVVVKHVYVERRVTPLDIYLQGAMKKDALAAVIDYGQAIKELAAINIFPGDLFLKNFGVTRYGRVVFYDYDEVCLVTDCRFRRIPEARNDMEELSNEPWYSVDEEDVFPEEFRTFLSFPKNLRDPFEQHHGDLFDVAFWQSMQEKLAAGKYIEVFPYDSKRRFQRAD